MKKLENAAKHLKNWGNDGFMVIDNPTPNAFVHGYIPQVRLSDGSRTALGRLSN
jgi:hypothetical protein